MKKAQIIILGLLSPFFVYICYVAALLVFGYELTHTPDILAEKLIQESRPAKDCFLFRSLDIGPRPSTYELQMRCVYVYAKDTGDAEACKLLLPSDYGMACLSTVGGKIFSGNHCGGRYGRDVVFCSRYSSEGEETIEYPQLKNCELYKRKDIKEWCYKTRTQQLSGVHECDKITHDIEYDDCESSYAFKQKDASLCKAVKDEARRKYCEIKIDTWFKYPDLQDSFYFGMKVPIDN